MTPSEKATELVDYFMPIVKDLEAAKKCAVKVCEEVIESDPTEPASGKHAENIYDYIDEAQVFWNQVI